MRRVLFMVVLAGVLAGCGVRPSGVLDGGRAPTGVAPGTPIYLVDGADRLVLRRAPEDGGELGTVGGAIKILLARPHDDLYSYAGHSGVAVDLPVTFSNELITISLPLARREIPNQLGLDQIVCTALAVHRQSGGSRGTEVVLNFTIGRHTAPRRCPVLP